MSYEKSPPKNNRIKIKHNLIYRLRKKGIIISTRKRTIYYVWDNDNQKEQVKQPGVVRLVNEFGFVRQSEIN